VGDYLVLLGGTTAGSIEVTTAGNDVTIASNVVVNNFTP
jgi:hypothetical protein